MLLEEVARYGVPTVKRAYGDWTTQQLVGWKDELNRNAIQPVQQFAYTTGKNSTDSALIIDAMDLLYTGNLDAFALVSSDSDFTRLATRLRESGQDRLRVRQATYAGVTGRRLRQVHLPRGARHAPASPPPSRRPDAATAAGAASAAQAGDRGEVRRRRLGQPRRGRPVPRRRSTRRSTRATTASAGWWRWCAPRTTWRSSRAAGRPGCACAEAEEARTRSGPRRRRPGRGAAKRQSG